MLIDSCVLFLDILGVEAGACGFERLDYLRRLKVALEEARASGHVDDQFLHVRALFSDSLIAAFPLAGALEPAEVIGPAEVMAARIQLELIKHGFFLRGGLSFGAHYMNPDLAFGPALVEAAQLEERADVPRVMLSHDAALAERAAVELDRAEDSRQRQYLLTDADHNSFISYLDVVIDVDSEAETRETLTLHRDMTCAKLREYAGQPRVEAKYLWVARYHNFVCTQRAPKGLGPEHLIDLGSQPCGLEVFAADLPDDERGIGGVSD